MRIAVSGTHCTGKSTLIEEFLRLHPDFSHEPEPYSVLVEDFGEEFQATPCADDFLRQLEFQVARLQSYPPEAKVICERSPADFLAYVLALRDLGSESIAESLVGRMLKMVRDAIVNLDLIVFLPLEAAEEIDSPEDENPRLRRAMDEQLIRILRDDQCDLFQARDAPRMIELFGPAQLRLRTVEAAIENGGFPQGN